MSFYRNFFFSIILSLLCSVVLGQNTSPRKIIIFYSDTGAGHKTIAAHIEKQVKKENPEAQVIMKNVWDFSTPTLYKAKKWAWSLIQKFPWTRDVIYQRSMEWGNNAGSLENVSRYHLAFDKDEVYEFINQNKPHIILSTNYSGAEILRTLRQQGLLDNIGIGWVMTDYAEGYWKRIVGYFDKTFLLHPKIAENWIAAGVQKEKLVSSGMPFDDSLQIPIDKNQILDAYGLSPQLKTIVLVAGSDGFAPFKEIVADIKGKVSTPLQLIVLTGKNKKAYDALTESSKEISDIFKLKVLSSLPRSEFLDLVKSSDLFITKAGGITPTEGLIMGIPMIVFSSPGGGVEQENIKFFQNQSLALTATEKNIGETTESFFKTPDIRQNLSKAQAQYISNLNKNAVLDFVLQYKPKPPFEISSLQTSSPVNRGMLLIDEKVSLQMRTELAYSATSSLDYNTCIQRASGDDIGLLQIKALRDAARRGVNVRWIMDGHGARKVSPGILQHLIQSGVQIKIFHPKSLEFFKDINSRLHDKTIIADAETVIVGGRNSQRSYYGVTPENNWHNFEDVEIIFQGPDAIGAKKYFDALWNSADVITLNHSNSVPTKAIKKAEAELNAINSDKVLTLLNGNWQVDLQSQFKPLGKLEFVADPINPDTNKLDKQNGITLEIFKLMKQAQEEVVIISPYFILNDRYEEFFKKLFSENEKLKITVYTNSQNSNDNPLIQGAFRRTVKKIETYGWNIHFYEYHGPMLPTKVGVKSKMLHPKIVYIDGATQAYIGSDNVTDNRSDQLNSENGVVLKENQISDDFIEYIKLTQSKSRLVSSPSVKYQESVPPTFCSRLLELIVRSKFITNQL